MAPFQHHPQSVGSSFALTASIPSGVDGSRWPVGARRSCNFCLQQLAKVPCKALVAVVSPETDHGMTAGCHRCIATALPRRSGQAAVDTLGCSTLLLLLAWQAGQQLEGCWPIPIVMHEQQQWLASSLHDSFCAFQQA